MLFLCRLNNNFERLHFVIFSFSLIFEDPRATLPPSPQMGNRKIQNPRVWRIWEDRFIFPKIFEGQKMMTRSVNRCTNFRATPEKQQKYGGYVCFMDITHVPPVFLALVKY